MVEKTGLVAFHGENLIKEKYLKRVRAHREADEIVAGHYWRKEGDSDVWKGCAVGCTIHGNEHGAYERALGIPRVIAQLEDSIFERLWNLDRKRAQKWPEEFLEAVPVGADLSDVSRQFLLWCLQKQVLPMAQPSPDCVAAVERVIALYERPREEDVAAGAAEATAWAAAGAAAAGAAECAAECAAARAEEWAAARAAGEAEDKGTIPQANELLRLLNDAGP